jgi:FAD:protein FMN transferase
MKPALIFFCPGRVGFGAALVCWLGVLGVFLDLSCAAQPRRNEDSADGVLARYEFTRPEMGVPFRIVLYAPNRTNAETAARAAFARVEALNARLSDYDTDSELNRLSRTSGRKQAIPVSPDLWRVLERAQTLASRTDGAFDVTVGPVVGLWRKARREKRFPKETLLKDAMGRTGYRHLHLDPRRHTARLDLPDMNLDLGGIAKGFAADEAMKVLRSHGVTRALVGGGGDMMAGQPPPGQSGWRVGLSSVTDPKAPPAEFVSLREKAIATSGDLFQVLEIEGRRYSHIVDPRTGIGLTNQCLMTVIASDGMSADSVATAVSVLGPAKGLNFARSQPDVAARILQNTREGVEKRETPGFVKFVVAP